jgi:hypothetical protein
MVKSDKNPGGLPMEVFDQIREGSANHRAQFYQDITLPFYKLFLPPPMRIAGSDGIQSRGSCVTGYNSVQQMFCAGGTSDEFFTSNGAKP